MFSTTQNSEKIQNIPLTVIRYGVNFKFQSVIYFYCVEGKGGGSTQITQFDRNSLGNFFIHIPDFKTRFDQNSGAQGF